MAVDETEARLVALEFASARTREQLAEIRLLFRMIMVELASHLASHADGGQTPSEWSEVFIGDVRVRLDDAEEADRQSSSPSPRLYEQARYQLALFATDLLRETDAR